jgi:chorismate mutase
MDNMKWPYSDKILFAGPCAAETEQQVMDTAGAVAADFPNAIFRSGIWKPRTRPDSFEGVGEAGLQWLQKVKKTTGLAVAVEVATAAHVEACLKYGIDIFWIGARTTGNPFSVQEIADALQGVDVPVYIKNPVYPDLNLWLGAVERIKRAGIKRTGAIFRGFYSYEVSQYRNIPRWEVALDLKTQMPDLTLICDISHIAGNTELLHTVAQQALDLDMNGLMIETHCNPSKALSDAKQQITPARLVELIASLEQRNPCFTDETALKQLEEIRIAIDAIDDELLDLLSRRMKYSRVIGRMKGEHRVTIFQLNRWKDILRICMEKSDALGLNKNYVRNIFIQIHDESVRLQSEVMNKQELNSGQ